LKDNNNISDTELIESIRNDDNKAFEQLYYRYSQQLYYFSLKYLKSKEDAEGLVQEIYAKLWEIRKTVICGESFSSFLFTIAKNTIFNKHRKKLNEENYKEHLRLHFDELYDKTENDIILADLKLRIDKQVEKLPPKRKQIYILSRERGLSYKEIAAELNISEKTIESHIRLALQAIRATLKGEILLPLFFTLSFMSNF